MGFMGFSCFILGAYRGYQVDLLSQLIIQVGIWDHNGANCGGPYLEVRGTYNWVITLLISQSQPNQLYPGAL